MDEPAEYEASSSPARAETSRFRMSEASPGISLSGLITPSPMITGRPRRARRSRCCRRHRVEATVSDRTSALPSSPLMAVMTSSLATEPSGDSTVISSSTIASPLSSSIAATTSSVTTSPSAVIPSVTASTTSMPASSCSLMPWSFLPGAIVATQREPSANTAIWQPERTRPVVSVSEGASIGRSVAWCRRRGAPQLAQ